MQIDYIKIIDHLRFPLLGSNVLEHTFTTGLVLIEGSNGAGKTTFMNELSPLPSDRNAYGKDGYKEIHVTYGGCNYVLISDFRKATPTFHFVLDGDELNVAGLITAQRELVFEHFALTQSVYDLMVGNEVFTTMTLGARKKFFSELLRVNIDHVIRGYNKINEDLKMSRLILKTEQTQLKIEEAKLTDEAGKLEAEENRKEINTTIDQLLGMRDYLYRRINHESNEGSYEDLLQLTEKRKDLLHKGYRLLTSYTEDKYETSLEGLNKSEIFLSSEIRSTYTELERIEDLMSQLNIEKDESTISPVDRLDYINAEIEEIHEHGGNIINIVDGSLKDKVQACIYINNNLRDLVAALPVNPLNNEGMRPYGKQRHQKLWESSTELQKGVNEIEGKLSMYSHAGDVVKGMDVDVSCPSCNHTWDLRETFGKDEGTIATLDHMRKCRVDGIKSLSIISEQIDEINKYFSQYKEILTVKANTFKHIPEFWNHIESTGMLTEQPKSVESIIKLLMVDCESLERLLDLESEANVKREMISVLEKVQGIKIEELIVKRESLIERSISLREELEGIVQEKSNLELSMKLRNEMKRIDKGIEFAKKGVKEFNLSYSLSQLVTVLDNQLRELKLAANEIDNDLHNQSIIQYAIDKHRRRVEEIEEEVKVLEIVSNELSPKNGVIARTISSSLNNIIHNVNRHLEKMWVYPMTLSPIDVGNDVLNYRFKLNVANIAKGMDDVSKASKGQQEGVNFAFKLVLYRMLGFDNYPLFLDELASNLDVEHTAMIAKIIQGFATTGEFSRVFIVSHKDNMGFLQDVDVISLS